MPGIFHYPCGRTAFVFPCKCKECDRPNKHPPQAIGETKKRLEHADAIRAMKAGS